MSIPGGSVPEPDCPELGFYGLAGHADDPRALLDEIVVAERIGLGSAFLSERFDTKDAAALAGAAAATSRTLGIGTAATNPHTRHPLVTATMATTLHRLSRGRYALGLGRGFDVLFDLMGLPRVTSARLEDTVDLLRTLWRGDAVVDRHGPAGDFPYLRRTAEDVDRIPILMVALGERTLDLAGRVADAVVLHTVFTGPATQPRPLRAQPPIFCSMYVLPGHMAGNRHHVGISDNSSGPAPSAGLRETRREGGRRRSSRGVRIRPCRPCAVARGGD